MNTLGLSVITLALATQSAFAQHAEAPVATVTVAMTLPADDVEITGKAGRKDKATVVNRHLRGFTVIRRQGGNTVNPWNGISGDMAIAITRKAPLPTAILRTREQGIADMPIEGFRRITFPCRPKHNFPLQEQTP